MKIKQLTELIRHIVMENLSFLNEGHQTGEWWIDEMGGTTYCDNQVVDQGHEGVVIETLTRQIISYFGIHADEPQHISDYEVNIKDQLDLTPEEDAAWENMPGGGSGGPPDIIIKKLLEDGEFKDAKQAEDAVYIAYGSNTRDARDYAMKYWGWKVMKTFNNNIEIQTWHLKPDDLQAIVKGIWEIDEDGEVDDSKTMINVTVQSKGKRFSKIPLDVLEKKMPQKLQQYQSGVHVGYTEAITEDYHFHHEEYRMYEGNRHAVVAFDDGSRLKFEIHFRNAHGIDKEKWSKKAVSTWKSCANELHRDVPLSDACNPIQKSWKDCFTEALSDPRLKPYVREKFEKLFNDKGYPPKVQGKPQTVVDPVNLTPR